MYANSPSAAFSPLRARSASLANVRDVLPSFISARNADIAPASPGTSATEARTNAGVASRFDGAAGVHSPLIEALDLAHPSAPVSPLATRLAGAGAVPTTPVSRTPAPGRPVVEPLQALGHFRQTAFEGLTQAVTQAGGKMPDINPGKLPLLSLELQRFASCHHVALQLAADNPDFAGSLDASVNKLKTFLESLTPGTLKRLESNGAEATSWLKALKEVNQGLALAINTGSMPQKMLNWCSNSIDDVIHSHANGQAQRHTGRELAPEAKKGINDLIDKAALGTVDSLTRMLLDGFGEKKSLAYLAGAMEYIHLQPRMTRRLQAVSPQPDVKPAVPKERPATPTVPEVPTSPDILPTPQNPAGGPVGDQTSRNAGSSVINNTNSNNTTTDNRSYVVNIHTGADRRNDSGDAAPGSGAMTPTDFFSGLNAFFDDKKLTPGTPVVIKEASVEDAGTQVDELGEGDAWLPGHHADSADATVMTVLAQGNGERVMNPNLTETLNDVGVGTGDDLAEPVRGDLSDTVGTGSGTDIASPVSDTVSMNGDIDTASTGTDTGSTSRVSVATGFDDETGGTLLSANPPGDAYHLANTGANGEPLDDGTDSVISEWSGTLVPFVLPPPVLPPIQTATAELTLEQLHRVELDRFINGRFRLLPGYVALTPLFAKQFSNAKFDQISARLLEGMKAVVQHISCDGDFPLERSLRNHFRVVFQALETVSSSMKETQDPLARYSAEDRAAFEHSFTIVQQVLSSFVPPKSPTSSIDRDSQHKIYSSVVRRLKANLGVVPLPDHLFTNSSVVDNSALGRIWLMVKALVGDETSKTFRTISDDLNHPPLTPDDRVVATELGATLRSASDYQQSSEALRRFASEPVLATPRAGEDGWQRSRSAPNLTFVGE